MSQSLRITLAISFISAIAAGQKPTLPRERIVALITGNHGYRYVTRLKTAVNDARAMQVILHDRYGFETTLSTDATRAQILAALSSYRRTLGPDSSLLIYFAGHGYANPAVDKTYWWSIDAKSEDNSEWISADDITAGVKALSARMFSSFRTLASPEPCPRGATPWRWSRICGSSGRTIGTWPSTDQTWQLFFTV